MNSIIEAHEDFKSWYNGDHGLSLLFNGDRKVIKVHPEVALYKKYEKPELTIEERLLFLLQEKLGIKNTNAIKEAIPGILELTDPDYYENPSTPEKAVEYEETWYSRQQLVFFEFLGTLDVEKTKTFYFHEESAIRSSEE